MRDGLKMDVSAAVDREKAASMTKFPLFNSPHEGYAVILEQVEELLDEVQTADGDNVCLYLERLWSRVKHNASGDRKAAALLYDRACAAACEAIQVAAMASKYLESAEKWDSRGEHDVSEDEGII